MGQGRVLGVSHAIGMLHNWVARLVSGSWVSCMCYLDPSWLSSVHVNLPAVKRRAETIGGRRTVKKQWQVQYVTKTTTNWFTISFPPRQCSWRPISSGLLHPTLIVYTQWCFRSFRHFNHSYLFTLPDMKQASYHKTSNTNPRLLLEQVIWPPPPSSLYLRPSF